LRQALGGRADARVHVARVEGAPHLGRRSGGRRVRAFDKSRQRTDKGTMDVQIESLKFDANGLIPAIIQDHRNGQVLAMFWTNREALEKTIQTGKVHSYSRSRGRLALKGESSGHLQLVKAVLTDCDQDVVLIQVDQLVAACHQGYRSCFYRQYEPNASDWKIIAQKVFDPDKVYQKK
jgi:phosphoribosyl-AMP cyclohydrolase